MIVVVFAVSLLSPVASPQTGDKNLLESAGPADNMTAMKLPIDAADGAFINWTCRRLRG